MKNLKPTTPLIDIIAPASLVSEKNLKIALKLLALMGFRTRLKGTTKTSSFFAQSQEACAKNINKAFLSSDSKIVWALRGGYGSQRLLPLLDKLNYKKWKKKLFIGHSDVTLLHDWIHHNLSWPTLHFPVLIALSETSATSRKQLQLFLNQAVSVEFKNLTVLNPAARFNHTKRARISGGNMTVIQHQIGTPWNRSRKNHILFLEDNANETPYRIHRTLWQMEQSGVFKGVKALIFGQWPERQSQIIKEVLKPFAQNQAFPVIIGLPCGHKKENKPLPLWTPARLSIKGSQAQLQIPLKSFK